VGQCAGPSRACAGEWTASTVAGHAARLLYAPHRGPRLRRWPLPPGQLTARRRRHKLLPRPLPLQELIAGGVAGSTAKSCIAPLERCKILFQVGQTLALSLWLGLLPVRPPPPPAAEHPPTLAHSLPCPPAFLPALQTGKLRGAGLAPTLVHIYRTEGVPGLFRGNGASVLRIVPYAAVHFTAYEQYRRLLVTSSLLGFQVWPCGVQSSRSSTPAGQRSESSAL
jgi:hypothetical protein